MIARYTRPEMGRIWSDENKFRTWLDVELAATETLADAGLVPQSAAKAIREKGGFDVARINEIEAEVKHDVIAFTTAVAEKVGPESRWLHYGLTSNDVVDTAQALMVKQASAIIREDLKKLRDVLQRRALEFKDTPAIGRTHGVHAEPISFGLKLAVWAFELERNRDRLTQALEQMRVGKLSGVVGSYAATDPRLEEIACKRLGLEPAPASTQIIQRDRHAELLNALALCASSLDKFALEIRHLARTEVREVQEPFGKGQKGSSAMPHKRNPVVAERICGLARVVRAAAVVGLENVALWHERDISHSSAERVVIPDAFFALDYMLERFAWLVDGMVVFPERMRRNLETSFGLYFSQRLLLALVSSGLPRDEAYRIVQRDAMRAWDTETSFRELVEADQEVTARLDGKALETVFDNDAYLEHVDTVFTRLDASVGKEKK